MMTLMAPEFVKRLQNNMLKADLEKEDVISSIEVTAQGNLKVGFYKSEETKLFRDAKDAVAFIESKMK
jgi:hypothetical protein